MNKNHSSINNYLTNSSLFKTGQKNRFVSSYVTHRNYFAQQGKSNNDPAIKIPNATKFKKQYDFISYESNPLHNSGRKGNEVIGETLRKDGFNDPISIHEANDQELFSPVESKIQHQHELLNIKQGVFQEREEGIPKINEKSVNQRSLHQLNREIIDSSNTKIVVNYSQIPSEKERTPKIKENALQYFKKDSLHQSSFAAKPQQNRNKGTNQNLEFYEKLLSSGQKQVNPYLPSSHKKQNEQLKVYQTTNGEVTLKKIESNSFNPVTPISSLGIAQTPRETLFMTHSSIQKKKDSYCTEEDYFVNIRNDMSGYLASVKQKLNGSYICLETIQYQFDGLIDKILQLQCQKLKNILYRIVDEEINDFKQFERREFSKNKFYFMSDLYQIKCNIDLRLDQIEHLQHQLKNEYKWKDTVNNILGINYNQNINFILKKSDEIEKELLSNINLHLNDYVKSVNDEVTSNMRKGIKTEFAGIYRRFNEVRFKNKYLSSKDPQ